ncbi:hypothetical protein [Streptomyces sp. NBC_00316]|uniref:hypothetical protein n=1 Tax=Streptomyces sp. NBC_00316 TaxID=2975710 RepID=UPI002E2AEEEE|nr:hypothetical protein [Streptomyces sp. NBC_00316]
MGDLARGAGSVLLRAHRGGGDVVGAVTRDSSRLAGAGIAADATGLVIRSTAAAAGLPAVLPADPGACAVVHVAGGVVRIVLGINTLRAAGREAAAPSAETDRDR